MRFLIPVVTSAESAARDAAAIGDGIPSRALMQRAGAAAAGEITLRYRDRLDAGVLVLAGPGSGKTRSMIEPHIARKPHTFSVRMKSTVKERRIA